MEVESDMRRYEKKERKEKNGAQRRWRRRAWSNVGCMRMYSSQAFDNHLPTARITFDDVPNNAR